MTCPLLGRTRPQCHAVGGAPLPLSREVVAAYCRGAHESCPAFRYLRATGRPSHPSDFRAWVLRGVPPGRTDPAEEAVSQPDGR